MRCIAIKFLRKKKKAYRGQQKGQHHACEGYIHTGNVLYIRGSHSINQVRFMLSYCRPLQTDKYNLTPSNSRFIFRQVSSPFSRPQLCTPKDPRYSGEGRTRLSLHPFGKGPRSPTNVILMLHKPYRQSGRLRFVYFHRKMVGV